MNELAEKASCTSSALSAVDCDRDRDGYGAVKKAIRKIDKRDRSRYRLYEVTEVMR